MNANIERMKLIFLVFLAMFAISAVGVGVWQVGWVIPRNECEKEQKKWWDPDQRVCAQPVLTSDITGRLITDDKALAEAKKAIGRTTPPAKTPDAKAEAAPKT